MFYITNIEFCDLLLFSVLLNIVMYVFLLMQRSRQSHSTKLFRDFILSVAVAGAFEASGWLLAIPGDAGIRPYYYLSNVLFFATNLLPVALGLRYLDYVITFSEEKNRKRLFLFLIPAYMNLGFILVNLFSDGFLFTIDAANVYHRGIGVYIGNAAAILFAFIIVIGFFRNRQMITGRITQIILVLTLLPVTGAVLQTLFYGASLGIPAYTLGIFLTFLLMERNELLKDPLTLLNSRIQMENRLQYKLKAQEPFTAMMIDVDGFKNINDVYGHTVGDEVLKDVSKILLSCANFEDFVCRFGGDEFFVILESPRDIGSTYRKRIHQVLTEYSQKHDFSTTLSFGCVYVRDTAKYDVEALVRATDQRMYEDKVNRKSACAP